MKSKIKGKIQKQNNSEAN